MGSTEDDIDYTPKAFICDLSDGTEFISPLDFNQGSVVSICITPDADSQAQGGTGLVMNEISELSFVLIGNDAVKQVALPENENFGLSDHETCVDQPYCLVSTVLMASFFTDEGSVSVTGKASLKFLGGVRRLTRGGDNNEGRRSLQDGVQAIAPFDMTLGVTKSDDRPTMLSAGGNSLTNTVPLFVMTGSVLITTVAYILM